jgi:membrane-bound serine protease (ClpP class)
MRLVNEFVRVKQVAWTLTACRLRTLLFAAFALLFASISYAQEGGSIYLLDLRGAIGPASSDYIHRAVEMARRERPALIILRIDTPGGLDTSMRGIIQDILQSPIPVVSFVSPSGARAASAGTYIVYASHVAAMAPGTNLGAATPVQIGGPLPSSSPEGGKDKDHVKDNGTKGAPETKPHPTMSDKVANDAIAYIRSLAELRGRNVEWAEKAVREAASISAEEALKTRVIDLIASDLDNLRTQLDGRVVVVLGATQKLHASGRQIRTIEPDWRTELLGIITNPNVAYLLLMLGFYGLVLEFTTPGYVAPGVIGAVSLLLALYAFQILPTNFAGLALIFLGMGLMVGEAFAPSFGSLGIGGVIAFVVGSVILLDTDVPGFRLSWMLIGTVALVSATFVAAVMILLLKSRQRPVVSGPEEMIGDIGQVIDWQEHDGTVRVRGEIWRARAMQSLAAGQRVRVDRLDGLTLVVKPELSR